MDRILAFGCHPDDVEYWAAGTLALLAERGYEIHMAVMAGGEVGHPNLKPQEIRQRRLAENTASAAILGGKSHYAGGHDLEVQYDAENRRWATRIIREVDPLIVLTCPPMDYLVDHEETSKLVRNACYIASVPNYDCGVPTVPTKRFPYVYYWNAMGVARHFRSSFAASLCGRRPLRPSKRKRRCSVATHPSSSGCNSTTSFEDFAAVMMDLSQKMGKQVGMEHAEGFMQHLGNGHPTDNILATILGNLCVDLPDRPTIFW